MRWKIRGLIGISLFLGSSGLIYGEAAPPLQKATQLISQAVSILKFSGAPVEGLLLTDPEKKDGFYRYRGEFNVATTAKKISCEDWTFTLREREGAWGVVDIVRGRCND